MPLIRRRQTGNPPNCRSAAPTAPTAGSAQDFAGGENRMTAPDGAPGGQPGTAPSARGTGHHPPSPGRGEPKGHIPPGFQKNLPQGGILTVFPIAIEALAKLLIDHHGHSAGSEASRMFRRLRSFTSFRMPGKQFGQRLH